MKTTSTQESIGKALGRIANGVYVVTASKDSTVSGMLATWISQAAFSPPMLTVAVKKERLLLNLLTNSANFTVNILGTKNMDIFKAFAKAQKEGKEDRFNQFQLETASLAGPVFSEAVAYLDCCVKNKVEAGDHILILAEVINGALLQTEREPMIHLRNNGFQY